MVSKKDKNQESESEFKVTDRRQFTAEGEARSPVPEPFEEPPEKADTASASAENPPEEISKKPSEETAEAGDSSDTTSASAENSPETINLSSFLISLATTGMVHLGEIPEPTTGQQMENMEGARQMIDILSILQEKTKGNLSPDEIRLFEGLLYELRMKFVSKSKAVDL